MLLHYFRMYYIVTIIAYAITFTSAQYIENFLRSAFDASQKLRPQDVVSSAIDVSRGVLLSANRALVPTPAEFFDIGINLIVGFPIEQVFTAINTFCK